MTTTVAFVGLGHMGLPMAARIAAGDGLAVRAFDISSDAMVAASRFSEPARSLSEAVRGADVICTMVPADRHLLAIAAELEAVVGADQVFVDFSTVSPQAIESVERRLGAAGARVVSASCMKSVAAAQAGELSLYVGGPADGIAVLQPIFARVAGEWSDVGSLGGAKTMKIVNNLLTATTGFCYLDGLVLAAVLGVVPEAAVTALRAAGAGSWVLEKQIVEHALADDLGEGIFSVAYMAKDLELAVALAQSVGRSSFFARLVLAGYRGTESLGMADHYHPSVVRWIERLTGIVPPIHTAAGTRAAGEFPQLWPGLLRVQQLVLDEALAIASAAGIEVQTAARLLQAGSARSDVLTVFLEQGFDRAGARSELLPALDLARDARVPALSLEVAAQLAALG